MRRKNVLRGVVALADHATDFLVNLDSRGFAVVAMLVDFAAQKDLFFFLTEGQWAEVAHAEFANHLARQFGGAFDVVAGTRTHLAEEHLFRNTATHHDGDLRLEILLGVVMLVINWKLHCDTERHAARNDRDLVHRVGVWQLGSDQRVSAFVVRRNLLFFFGQDERFTLRAHQDLILSQLEVVLQHGLAVLASRAQSGFIHHVGEIGSGEARCSTCQHREIYIFSQRNLAGMYSQNFLTSANIRTIDDDAAIEAPGAQQSRIEHVGPVRGSHQDDTFVRLEAVHLNQQLVQRLFALIVTTSETCAAVTADSVNFIDEDDAGRIFLALFEQVANAAGANADEHFYEVGPRNREKWHVCFASNCPGKEGLTGSRRSNQQHSLGNASTQFLELLGFAQELNNLLELFLGLLHAGDILKRHLFLLHGEQPGPALTERQGLISAGLHLPDHEEP